MFIYLPKLTKSCISKPVDHFNPMLSPNFEFPVTETEEEKDEYGSPMRVLVYWGISAVKSYKQRHQEDCPNEGIHLQRLAWDANICFAQSIIHQVHASTGATPPSSLNEQHMDTVLQYALQQGQPPLHPSV